MTTATVITLIALVIVIAAHTAVIARWTGLTNGQLMAINQRLDAFAVEILRLREARHVADGTIQRHEGWLRQLDRRQSVRRDSDDGGDP